MQSAERRFALFILAIFLAVNTALIAAAAASWSSLVPDFFGFWSTAQFLQTHEAAQAYDIHQLAAFQHALRPDFTVIYPAPYSPVFLLAIRPLAWMSAGWAQLAWVGLTFTAFAGAAFAALRQRDLMALLLLSPLMALNAIYGQTGLLTAALMIGAVLLPPARPWLAGLCMALLSFKPQLGLLMPVMLLARRDWFTIAATVAWLLALIVLTSAILGWTIWWDWILTLAGHGDLIALNRDHMVGIMTTVTSAALSLGASLGFAQVVQIIAAIVITTIIWFAWRRAHQDLATAATWIGGFLVTPYAFVYDTPVAICAALLFLRHCRKQGELPATDLMAVLFVLIAPLFILTAPPQPPAAPLALLILVAAITRRMFRPA